MVFFRNCPSGYLSSNYLTRFGLIYPNIIDMFGPVYPNLHTKFGPEFPNPVSNMDNEKFKLGKRGRLLLKVGMKGLKAAEGMKVRKNVSCSHGFFVAKIRDRKSVV